MSDTYILLNFWLHTTLRFPESLTTMSATSAYYLIFDLHYISVWIRITMSVTSANLKFSNSKQLTTDQKRLTCCGRLQWFPLTATALKYFQPVARTLENPYCSLKRICVLLNSRLK
jgi:hypothetical protein